MTLDPQGTVIALFLAFCRIGGCMMILPGFSSARMPMQIRLFISVALSIAILPLVWDVLYSKSTSDPLTLTKLIISESMIGIMFGMIARFYVIGLQFAGSALSSAISFTGPAGQDILEDTSENQLTNLLTFAGLMILFILDFHHIVFKAVAESYTSMPVGQMVNSQKMLITLTNTLSASFMIVLRLVSPFLVFGLMFNVAVGMINKLAPQIPVYFISTPYALMGGLFLLYLGIGALLRQFADGFIPVFVSF